MAELGDPDDDDDDDDELLDDALGVSENDDELDELELIDDKLVVSLENASQHVLLSSSDAAQSGRSSQMLAGGPRAARGFAGPGFAGNAPVWAGQKSKVEANVQTVEQRRALHRVSAMQFVHLVANRVYFSYAYAVFYSVMLLLNVVVLVWLVAHGSEMPSDAFIGLEIAVTALLGLEVVVRMLTQGRKYWRRLSNWFEFLVLVLCSASITLTHSQAAGRLTVGEEFEDIFSWTLFGARYVLQGLRLFTLLRHRKRIAQRFGELAIARSGRPHSISQVTRTSSQGIIDFEAISPDLADVEENEQAPVTRAGAGLRAIELARIEGSNASAPVQGPDKVRTRGGTGLRAIELARIEGSDASAF